MASRREYEMLFGLNARLNGGFQGTFSKAQAQFTRLGNEIRKLSRVQSDISAYQKQQRAIEATTRKLESLKRQQALVRQEISQAKAAGQSTAALEREELKLGQRINDTSAALNQQNEKLTTTGNRLREAGVNTNNLAGESVRLTTRLGELRREQDRAADGARSFGERTVEAFNAAQEAILAAGITTALQEIARAYMACVEAAGGLEETMSTVEALSGSNAAEMDQLTAKAKDLGATTKFTAQESAEAMSYMAMAGWDAQEMMSGMDGVLNLAAAAGEDLAMVSDIVTDNLTAFGLTAADTARFSDVLAAAATNSNTSVSIMGETFKSSAAIAGALGYSIEDVAIATGLMANAGVKGSIAGTALRNIFNGLLEGATLTGAAFGEYTYSAVQAGGTMKDFGTTLNELRGVFAQMTEAERVNNAMTLAGARGYNGLLAILRATDEDYISLTASINECSGAAEKMAAIKLDNMNGQLTLMKSSFDALKTSIGEQFIPEMRGLYSVGTDVFAALDSFAQKNPALVKAITVFVGAIGMATAGLAAYAAVTKAVIPLMQLFAASIPGVNIFFGVAAAVSAVVAAIAGIASVAERSGPSLKELTQAAREMDGTMADVCATYDESITATQAAADVADRYVQRLKELEATGLKTEDQQRQYHGTLALLCQTVPELAGLIDLETDSIQGGTAALEANTQAWRRNALQKAVQEKMNGLYESYAKVELEAAENGVKLAAAESKKEIAAKDLAQAQQRMNTLYAQAKSEADAYNKTHAGHLSAAKFLDREYYSLANSVQNYKEEIADANREENRYSQAVEQGTDALDRARAEMDQAEADAKAYTEALGLSGDAAQDVAGQTDGLSDALGSLSGAYTETYAKAYESISGQIGLFEDMTMEVDTSVDQMIANLQSQSTYLENYAQNLRTVMEWGVDEGIVEKLADGSAESAKYLQAIVNGGKSKVAELNAAFAKVAEGKDTFARTIDEMQNHLSGAMSDMVSTVASGVAGMNLSHAASSAAAATMNAFISTIRSKKPELTRELSAVQTAANAAMYLASRVMGVPGFASGTKSAPPGLAVVGENGPELVYFHGGEQVLNASETAAMQSKLDAELQMVALHPQLIAAMNARAAVPAEPRQTVGAAGNAPVSMQVVFQISGNATRETVDALRDYGDDFARRVLEVMENAQEDAVRRAYR